MAGVDTSYVFPNAIPSYVKATTTPGYVKATTDVILDFNSKNKQLVEAVSVSDVAGITVQFNLIPLDVINIAEMATVVTAKGIADSLSLADVYLLDTGINKVDAVSFTDAHLFSTTKGLADTAAINEAIALGNTKPFTDTANFTDAPAVQFTIGIANAVFAADGAMGGYGGALNAAALNVHSLLGTTGLMMIDDVTVTIT